MPESNYLDGAENQYGLPQPVPQGLGEQASAIVDSYLKRFEGLVYVCDRNGNPAYMRNMQPSMTYTIAGGVAAGQNVSVVVSPANVRPDLVGEVMILDRINPDLLEAVSVLSVSGNNTVTFANVQFAHGANCKADVGCVITEDRNVPIKRSIVRFAKWPMGAMLSLMGRYAYGRRSDQVGGLYQEMNLLAAVQTFGGPPQWIPIPINQISVSNDSGEVWVPAGMLLAYYSDVKMKYVAGWPQVPDPVVRATAAIASQLVESNQFGGGAVRLIASGDSRIERFGPTTMDDDTRRLLEPFRARLFY